MRKGEKTRDAILDRALRMASELGLEGLTIGRLADELELSKSGLFAHFSSKENLQVQTLIAPPSGSSTRSFARGSRRRRGSRGSARYSRAGSTGRSA